MKKIIILAAAMLFSWQGIQAQNDNSDEDNDVITVTDKDGKSEEFDGISLIGWTNGNKIASLKEFGCNMTHYDPYEEGSLPKFRDEKIRWF